jgi:hypothetical protein
MPSSQTWITVMALTAAAAWYLGRGDGGGEPGGGGGVLAAPPSQPRYPDLAEYDDIAPLHRRRALDMLRRFADVYQKTFAAQPHAAARELVEDMHETRFRALAAMYEIRMRLPNDAVAYDALTRDIESVERSTLVHIDDASRRNVLGSVHTKPVGDHYYAHWYRAANDVEH